MRRCSFIGAQDTRLPAALHQALARANSSSKKSLFEASDARFLIKPLKQATHPYLAAKPPPPTYLIPML